MFCNWEHIKFAWGWPEGPVTLILDPLFQFQGANIYYLKIPPGTNTADNVEVLPERFQF